MKNENLKKYFKQRLNHKTFTIILGIYLFLCLASSVYWCIEFQVRNLFMSLIFMLFVPIILLFEYSLKIRFGEIFTIGVLSIALGAILGSCFNVYTIIPFLDTLLHGLSGILFSCLGFTLAEKFFNKVETKKSFFGCLLFAVCFSLAIALAWELFEYLCTVLFGWDMMEDTYVTNINSYLLAGSHTETVQIQGIIKTLIYYGNGQTYTMNGYLDLGLLDTLTDMTVCVGGTLVFIVVSLIGFFKFPQLNRMLIPQIIEEAQ